MAQNFIAMHCKCKKTVGGKAKAGTMGNKCTCDVESGKTAKRLGIEYLYMQEKR